MNFDKYSPECLYFCIKRKGLYLIKTNNNIVPLFQCKSITRLYNHIKFDLNPKGIKVNIMF